MVLYEKAWSPRELLDWCRIYESCKTVVRCTVGVTEEFKVEVGLHQGLSLSPFLFTTVKDRPTYEVREETPWTMMFEDDIVICSESWWSKIWRGGRKERNKG